MTKDAAYEKLVDRLAQKWERVIDSEAQAVVARLREEYSEDRVQAAADAVEEILFDSKEWFTVEAVDISDIAWDAAYRADGDLWKL